MNTVTLTISVHPDSVDLLRAILAEARSQAWKYQQNSPLRRQDPETRRYHWGTVQSDLRSMDVQLNQVQDARDS